MSFEEGFNNWKKTKEMWTRFNTTEQTVIERVLDVIDYEDIRYVEDEEILDMICHQSNLVADANDACGYETDIVDENAALDYIKLRRPGIFNR